MTKEYDLQRIESTIEKSLRYHSQHALVAEGDSLELLRSMPAQSVGLILTDPPYHSTKKKNIYGDTSFAEDQHFVEWMTEYATEWKRVLRPNGSLFCFCSSSMSAKLEIAFSKEFNVLSHVVWTKPNDPGFDGWKGKMKKEALRQWYPHSERILFAEPAAEGNLHRSPFAEFLRAKRLQSGLSGNQLTELIGAYGKVNHGGAVSNWETGRNIPSREQYEKMCDAFLATERVEYMPPYEEAVRVFRVNGSIEFTDVWNFSSVRPYRGKHPAEKPLDLLEHAIAATTFPGDIVLDCFAGSGNTAIAALNLHRKAVSIEIEPKWTSQIVSKMEAMEHANRLENISRRVSHSESRVQLSRPSRSPQVSLFELVNES
jgi:site-specific DNA-methyltransferase (adenine-specific)